MEEKLTRQELEWIGVGLNAKIRELEKQLKSWESQGYEKYIEETKSELHEIKNLQQKILRMCSYK